MNHREMNDKICGVLWGHRRHYLVRDEQLIDLKDYDFLTGNGMLLLIEEARKQGVSLVNIPVFGEGYTAFAFEHNDFWDWIHDKGMVMPLSEVEVKTAPLAVALAFLLAHGVDVTEYLEGIQNENIS